MSKLKNIIKRNKGISKIAEMIIDGSKWAYDNTINRICWIMYSIHPINENKIVICNYYGRGFSDNAKYIAMECIKRKLDYDIVWLVSNMEKNEEFPGSIRLVKYGSFKAIKELATARIWIDNSRKNYYTRKRKKQLYIQTWHGGIALKKIEKDAENALNKSYVKFAKKDSENADVFISNSKFNTNMYENAFWYDGEVLECGVPRNDLLFNNVKETTDKVKDFFNIDINKKIVMYAPTFRKDNNLDVYKFDYEKCIQEFNERFSEEYVMLIRLHPNVFHKSTELNFNSENVLNASFYPDMQELLVATDILITDYSSSMFDFMLTKKPCFIYASDIKNYSDDRGFYFELKKLPFVISKSTEEMIRNIESFDKERYLDQVDKFLKEQGCVDDGNASSRVVDWIENNM
ncbi:CDP-glycerol glycerophosphotransferase family protein [Clostridium sp. NSJ-6]|uniref:CDP-glycerol glycerophosphotransferase family protein n=1 Tax=Clostridium hominis TaxID=2763036 RepID=A0ABR7DAZ3_9CLOT|nr:CDP-glycerol glycerophosphotransferase family protein [Clostridium hominis]MBC5628053.1 CDP-glycerol glycerophosphotransferase family protein [Clostridium hominis]MDU2673184.1 CDP-glycerol glycerophosphotransferase family protein [Clostridium sp.]